MPEATIICCDCSEYMRNGDFHPSRFDSQSDAVSLIANAKTQQNHENTVGLIAMHPNAKADVLVNCTQDIGRVLNSLAKMKIGDNSLIKPPALDDNGSGSDNKDDDECDSINVLVALQTAQLALKHRKNKKQDQRIILFVGSPITKAQNEKLLIKAAKRLKKNNVSVDIVNFGESEENTGLLENFINAVKANDNSNLVTVESGKLLSDVLISTPIFSQSGQQINEYSGMGGDADLNAAIRASQQDGSGGAAAGGGAAAEFGGIDPNADPELAMALRMSMEEERQRQEQEAKKKAQEAASGDASGADQAAQQPADQAGAGGDAAAAAPPANEQGGALSAMADELGIDEDDEELLKALQMSMEENEQDVDMAGNDDANNGDGAIRDELLDALPGITQEDLDEIGNLEDLLGNEDGNNGNDNNEEDKGKEEDKDKKKKDENK
eukprot:CAMPEP_0197023808 /NCGR_PEP_ID=MMETSP1384-20130603/4447_1 /TAXON_ID=29189 /ORGANISM="Ammonia sp." /LENGTH=438 /DNA_ID=CAMNT_0042452077 /DNA_START=73 /DNA_END=1389 /DNA_ORIENTATION=+